MYSCKLSIILHYGTHQVPSPSGSQVVVCRFEGCFFYLPGCLNEQPDSLEWNGSLRLLYIDGVDSSCSELIVDDWEQLRSACKLFR